MSVEDYCELCDLPKSTCVHGQPPPPPAPTGPQARVAPVKRAPARKTTAASAPARAVPRKWTPPDSFKPEIVDILREAGGRLDADDLFLELEARMEERLTTADHQKTPEGELRWRYAARRARQALIAEGLMTKGTPGEWALDAG